MCMSNTFPGDTVAAGLGTTPAGLKENFDVELTANICFYTEKETGERTMRWWIISLLETYHRQWGREGISRLTSLTYFKEKETDPKKMNDLSEVNPQGARGMFARGPQMTCTKLSISLFIMIPNWTYFQQQ